MADSSRTTYFLDKLREGVRLSREEIFELQTVFDSLQEERTKPGTEHHTHATPNSYHTDHRTSALTELTGILDQVEVEKEG